MSLDDWRYRNQYDNIESCKLVYGIVEDREVKLYEPILLIYVQGVYIAQCKIWNV